MLIAARLPRVVISALLLSFLQFAPSNAQDVEPFKFFRIYVGLHEDQITAIRGGKPVAKHAGRSVRIRLDVCAVYSLQPIAERR